MDISESDNVPGHIRASIDTFWPRRTPLFSSSGGHGSHQQLGHLYVDLPSTNLPGDHSNGITPIATQAIEYGGPLIDPPSYIEPLTSWGSHIGEISYPVPQHTVPSNRIPQQNPPLGPHMQTISMADALGYDVLGRHNGGASHGSPQYDTQEAQGFLGNPIDLMEPLGHSVVPLPTYDIVVDTSPSLKRRARNWLCPAPGCLQSFCRRQDRNRHLLTHLPHWIHCPHPGCPWRGDRLSLFRRHWDRDNDHPSSSRDLDDRQFRTYDPRPLVGKIEKGSLSIQDAKKYAILMVRKKALDISQPELYENPWGRKGGGVQRLG